MGKVKAFYQYREDREEEADAGLEDIYQSQLHDQSQMIKLILTLDSLATAFGADTRKWIEIQHPKSKEVYERIFGE